MLKKYAVEALPLMYGASYDLFACNNWAAAYTNIKPGK